jgi:hypothetical protein
LVHVHFVVLVCPFLPDSLGHSLLDQILFDTQNVRTIWQNKKEGAHTRKCEETE